MVVPGSSGGSATIASSDSPSATAPRQSAREPWRRPKPTRGPAAEAPDHVGDEGLAEEGLEGDRDAAVLEVAGLLDLGQSRADQRQAVLRDLREPPPRLRQHDPAALATQQRGADELRQARERAAGGGLRHAELGGGRGDAPGPGHGDEHRQQPEDRGVVHALSV